MIEGGEKRKSRFREHGKDERWLHWEFNEENLENKAQYVSYMKKKKNTNSNTMAVVGCATDFLRVVVVLCMCPSRTIRRGKHCDISRPSYSNQEIKVPFFPAALSWMLLPPTTITCGSHEFAISTSLVWLKKGG